MSFYKCNSILVTPVSFPSLKMSSYHSSNAQKWNHAERRLLSFSLIQHNDYENNHLAVYLSHPSLFGIRLLFMLSGIPLYEINLPK